jgi:hypothetical protein
LVFFFFFFSRVLAVVNAEDLDDVEQHPERNEQRCVVVVDISRGNGNKALSRMRYLKGVLCG